MTSAAREDIGLNIILKDYIQLETVWKTCLEKLH